MPSDERIARFMLQAALSSLDAAKYALDAWDRHTGLDDRDPIPQLRHEIDMLVGRLANGMATLRTILDGDIP